MADLGGEPITAGPASAGFVARPATADDLEEVARVFVSAFPQELRLLFGSRPRVAEGVLSHVFQCDHPGGRGAWVACLPDGAIIGMLLLESPPEFRQRYTWRLGWHVAWHHVGLWGLPRLALGLLLPRHAASPGEVYVRAIGVAAPHRGNGAGTLLLRCAEAWGRRHRKGWLGLHVSAENPRAHALYRRMGYTDRRYQSSLVTWIALRQRGATYMVKPLRESGE